MGAMTRRDFAARCSGIFTIAAGRLNNGETIQSVLLGLNARGHSAVQVLFVDATVAEDSAAAAAAGGGAEHGSVHLLEGPPGNRVAEMRSLLRQGRCSAAVFVTEAWALTEADAADGLFPSEHPNRIDTLQVVGSWPREFISVHLTGHIRTRSGGRRSVSEVPQAYPGLPFGWLAQALPGS